MAIFQLGSHRAAIVLQGKGDLEISETNEYFLFGIYIPFWLRVTIVGHEREICCGARLFDWMDCDWAKGEV